MQKVPAIQHPGLPNLQLQVSPQTFTFFSPILSCIPGFLFWNHQYPFVQLVDDWWPYQLERVQFLLFISNDRIIQRDFLTWVRIRPKLLLGFGVAVLLFDETSVSVIGKSLRIVL